MEDNLEHCVPTSKRRETFVEFQIQNSYGVPEWTNTSSSATLMYNLCEGYAAMTLDDH